MSPARVLVALVAIIAMVLACVTTLLALHIDILPVIGILNLVVLPIVGFIIYNKQQEVKEVSQQAVTNTNGVNQRAYDLMLDMWNHFKTTSTAANVVAPVVTEPTEAKAE